MGYERKAIDDRPDDLDRPISLASIIVTILFVILVTIAVFA